MRTTTRAAGPTSGALFGCLSNPLCRIETSRGNNHRSCLAAPSESSNGFMAYTDTGVGAVRGEAEKRRSWDAAMLRRAEAAPAGVEFIPFSLEASGVWGPAARRFFAKCLYLADDDRDIDVYHWSSAKFSSTWHDTFSILLARGRAQVSVAASRGDWPKRTQDQAYSDQNHASAA